MTAIRRKGVTTYHQEMIELWNDKWSKGDSDKE